MKKLAYLCLAVLMIGSGGPHKANSKRVGGPSVSARSGPIAARFSICNELLRRRVGGLVFSMKVKTGRLAIVIKTIIFNKIYGFLSELTLRKECLSEIRQWASTCSVLEDIVARSGGVRTPSLAPSEFARENHGQIAFT
jgi:hypothetical protein